MQKQDFYSLPRSIQDRFIESSQAVAAPKPVAVKAAAGWARWAWAAGAAVFVLIWAWFTTIGFGDLGSSFALSSWSQKATQIVLAGLTVFCALRAYALTWISAQIPYGNGDYLFPAGIVSARGATLKEYDSVEVESTAAVGADLRVSLRGGPSFSFAAGSPEAATQAVATFDAAREKWTQLTDAKPLEQARLRPLMESGVPNPLAPTDAYPRPRLLPLPVILVVVTVAGGILGIGVSTSRDSLSRKALYKAAVAENSVEAYQAYLKRGGKKREVRQLLLPRAELEQAVKEGSVEALQAFQDKNPKLEIGAEIQNALRVALLKELKKAIAVGTVTALDDVPKRFASHGLIAGEIAAARQAVFAKVLVDFEAVASDKLKGLLPFVREMLMFSQVHGPAAELRFVQEFPQTPERLDKVVAKSKKYYMGRKSLPTQYFLGKVARRREEAVLKTLLARLQKAFPKDVVEFRLGPAPSAENVDPPEVKVPTITFSHRERLSGGFVGGKPKAMYLGAAILMGAEGEIPGKPDLSLVFKWNAWRSPNFKVLSDRKKDIPDVYDDMMGGTFDKFAELYLGRWFQEP